MAIIRTDLERYFPLGCKRLIGHRKSSVSVDTFCRRQTGHSKCVKSKGQASVGTAGEVFGPYFGLFGRHCQLASVR